jgi:hypothetical protein
MEQPPLKRQKIGATSDDANLPGVASNGGGKYLRESDVGITEFINREIEGFDCILKYRFAHCCPR